MRLQILQRRLLRQIEKGAGKDGWFKVADDDPTWARIIKLPYQFVDLQRTEEGCAVRLKDAAKIVLEWT